MPKLPNFVKIKNVLNTSKFKIKMFISFYNALNLCCEHFELSLKYFVKKVNILAKFGKFISEKLEYHLRKIETLVLSL